jgi:hypothetical protein
MFYVQVQQVATGRLLGQPDPFGTRCGALAYRLWLESQGVPAGYVVRAWEAPPCCWCDRPATTTVRSGEVQIDPCCDRHGEGWMPTAVLHPETCCRACGVLCPEGTTRCASCVGKPGSDKPRTERGAA